MRTLIFKNSNWVIKKKDNSSLKENSEFLLTDKDLIDKDWEENEKVNISFTKKSLNNLLKYLDAIISTYKDKTETEE